MMAFCPEGVDMRQFSDERWYCREAAKANPTDAQAMKEIILKELRVVLRKA